MHGSKVKRSVRHQLDARDCCIAHVRKVGGALAKKRSSVREWKFMSDSRFHFGVFVTACAQWARVISAVALTRGGRVEDARHSADEGKKKK